MKRILIYVFVLVLLCFVIPIVLTNDIFKIKVEETLVVVNEEIEIEELIKTESTYDYKLYANIKLLHQNTGEIEEVSFDEYLYGVLSAEMPADYEIEALKSQAVVARTYTLYKIINSGSKHGEADICDSYTCCQAWISKEDRFARWDEEKQEIYWNKIETAVNTTEGKFITYEGKPINAFFHANSGGATEAPVNVWGGTGYPYLQSVETSGEDSYSQYESDAIFSLEEFEEKVLEIHNNFEIDYTRNRLCCSERIHRRKSSFNIEGWKFRT